MTIPQTYRLADYEQLLFQEIKVIQKNKLEIKGKLLDVIPDDSHSGLHKLIIEQGFISMGRVGNIVLEPKLAVATVYTRNIAVVEKLSDVKNLVIE